MMTCDRDFLHIFSAWTVPVCLLRIRGELAIGAHLRATDLYTVGRLILTMMQSCASAAKLRAAGPFFRSASSAMFEYGFPPPRIVNSAVVLKSQRAPNGAEWYARSGKPFQDAGRKTTPSSGSPVVTKRQSAIISLRASATIIVLRVPLRLSAVRARYHNASALSF